MRVLLAALALLPALATAQTDLGTYQITGGTYQVYGPSNLTGNGFTVTMQGYPTPDYSSGQDIFLGQNDFTTLVEPLAGNDNAFYFQASGINSGAFVPLMLGPYINEYGQMSSPLIDVTGGGTYTDTFNLNADLYYGLPGSQTESAYLNLAGHGTFTFNVFPFTPCDAADPTNCGPMRITSVDYHFVPELDPASLSGALTLLCGGFLVLRGRRSRAR